jgi:mRNA interferase MazF
MQKDFDKWNEQKKELDKKQKDMLFKEREIWWCNLGLNIGDEENGKGEKSTRPILIIKKI